MRNRVKYFHAGELPAMSCTVPDRSHRPTYADRIIILVASDYVELTPMLRKWLTDLAAAMLFRGGGHGELRRVRGTAAPSPSRDPLPDFYGSAKH